MTSFNVISDITRIILSATVIYFLVILFIRILGKRTTSRMNNFDWIVTIAIGSIVAATTLQPNISIPEGVVAVLMLMSLQFMVTKLTLHYPLWNNLVRSFPQLIMFDGEFMEKNMKKERIVKSEAYAAIRGNGIKKKEDVYAMVLETNAALSVVCKNDDNSLLILSGVEGLPKHLENEIKKLEKSEKHSEE